LRTEKHIYSRQVKTSRLWGRPMISSEERLNLWTKIFTKAKITRRDNNRLFSSLRTISDSKKRRLMTKRRDSQFLRRSQETFKIDKRFLAISVIRELFKSKEWLCRLKKLIEKSFKWSNLLSLSMSRLMMSRDQTIDLLNFKSNC
jgi:hypothetical protein